MLDELQQRNQSEIYHTQVAAERDRLRQLFRQVSGQARTQELRAGQAYLPKESKLTHGTVVSCLFALRFFFVKRLSDISAASCLRLLIIAESLLRLSHAAPHCWDYTLGRR